MVSFKTNISTFWDWFQENSNELTESFINDKYSLHETLRNELSKVFGEIGLLVGGRPGELDLMLSPERSNDRRIIGRFWKEQAPPIPGWNFFNFKKRNISYGNKLIDKESGTEISGDDFYVLLKPFDKMEKLDLDVYCTKAIEKYLFLVLDDYLGEGLVEAALGEIKFVERKKWRMIPVSRLYDSIVKIFSKNKWIFTENPDNIYTGIGLKPNVNSKQYRDDIFFGSNFNIDLLTYHIHRDRKGIDYICSVGADYIFLAYSHQNIPLDQHLDYRDQMAGAIETFLHSRKLGYFMGTASGIFNSYIDLLIFDVEEFNSLIGTVLKDYDVSIKYMSFSGL